MKSIFYSVLFIPFVIVSCGGEAEADTDESTDEVVDTGGNETVEVEVVENTYFIGSGMAGIFNIGEEVPDPLPEGLKMRHFLETDTDDNGKEIEHTHNVVFNQLEDIVELIMEKGTDEHHEDKSIDEMMILSNYYETEDSISVGSTKEDFLNTYGDATFWFDNIHKRYYVESAALVGGQFIFDDVDVVKKASGSQDFQEISASYINDGAKIKKIRIF